MIRPVLEILHVPVRRSHLGFGGCRRNGLGERPMRCPTMHLTRAGRLLSQCRPRSSRPRFLPAGTPGRDGRIRITARPGNPRRWPPVSPWPIRRSATGPPVGQVAGPYWRDGMTGQTDADQVLDAPSSDIRLPLSTVGSPAPCPCHPPRPHADRSPGSTHPKLPHSNCAGRSTYSRRCAPRCATGPCEPRTRDVA